MRRASVIVAALAGLGVTVAGCGSTATKTVAVTETVTRTETVTETETVSEPPDATPTTTATETTDGRERTIRRLGGTGYDDGVGFRVTSIEVVPSIQQDEYSDPPVVYPIKGAKLVTVRVTIINEAKTGVDPFCGGGGAVLIDDRDRNFDPLSTVQLGIPGNSICRELQPGFKATNTLAFQVPKDAQVNGVAVWNSSDADYSGKSYIFFGA